MISPKSIQAASPTGHRGGWLGTTGYLAIFFWSLLMMLLARPARIPMAAACCLLVTLLVYPISVKWLFNPRRLILMALMAVPPIFFTGDVNGGAIGVAPTWEGVQAGIEIALRFVVIMAALDGLTATVDISSFAGLLERLGLHGLGFSMGVALNLLPSLQQSCKNAWRSLWMRGGLRRQRWRGVQYLLATIGTNALRRAEEIALAAEARAFSPENARPLPIKSGRWDAVVGVVAVLLMAGILLT